MVWDNLSAHLATESFFETEHPDWFEFFNFPTYSPELNPVEQCWRQMKHVYLCNFVPTSEVELKSAVFSAAMRINEEHLLSSFFKHAGVKL